METVCIKLDEGFAREVEQVMKRHRYATKTEFIREAVRDKISDLDKELALARVRALYGSSPRKTTDAQLHAARELAFEEIAASLESKTSTTSRTRKKS